MWERDGFFALRSRVLPPHPRPLEESSEATRFDVPVIYETRRAFGRSSGYAIPLPPGPYLVTLHFARSGRSRQQRFDIVVEEQVLESQYVVRQERGEVTRARWAGRVEVGDALLEIQFDPFGVLCGLEIEPVE